MGAPTATVRAVRDRLDAADPAVVVPAIERHVAATLDRAWPTGWQPAEVVWQARRRNRAAGEAAVAAVAVAARRWAGLDLHPVWRAQLDELGIDPPADATAEPAADATGTGDEAAGTGRTRDTATGRTRDAESAPGRGPAAGTDRTRDAGTWGAAVAATHGLGALVDLVAALDLWPIEVLLPVPGRPDIALASTSVGDDGATAGIDPAVLERVRALLAKAESTTFEAEAQAFTAKAHELMTRHSLEHALVSSGPADHDRPQARRFCIDDPYADAKAFLLTVIAGASRCRAVQLGGLSMVTVVGFGSDLAAVDVLFTSLLVQAQTSLGELARSSGAGARERSRGFRSSFLRGFAQRIGDRLDAAGAATVADLDRSSGGALVPVLADRSEAVDGHVAEMFPRMTTKAVAGPTDALGWHAGQDAADRADLPWDRLSAG